jgi:hypothetical protein
MRLKNWDKLISITEKILHLCPNNPKAAFRLATGYKEISEFEKAIKSL